MTRQRLNTFAMGRGMSGISRGGQGIPRAVLLAALGLAVVTLAMLGGRPAPAQAQSSQVVGKLFNAANYSGGELPLNAGSIVNLVGTTWDNQAASIRVEPGAMVALYSDRNLTGVCEVFTASDPYLGNNPIRYRSVTSYHVGANCWAPVVRLYEHPNYGGEGRVAGAIDGWQRADLRRVGFDDTVSSLRVPAGQKIAVWEHPDFKGHCEVFTASDADLRNNRIGDDSISSFRLGAC